MRYAHAGFLGGCNVDGGACAFRGPIYSLKLGEISPMATGVNAKRERGREGWVAGPWVGDTAKTPSQQHPLGSCLWNLVFLTRDRVRAPCIGSVGS